MGFSRFSPRLSPAGEDMGGEGSAIPPDLAAFLSMATARQASATLGATGTQVRQLRAGEIGVPPRVLGRWLACRARYLVPCAPWQVRRVDAQGAVRLAGRRYASPALQPRAGQQINVALLADGRLLAQTLELPAQRLPLAAV